MSKTIEIRGVPDALYNRLERNAAAHGITLAEYVLQELDEVGSVDVHASWEEAFKALEQLTPMVGGPSSVQLVEEGRAERDAELDSRLGIRAAE